MTKNDIVLKIASDLNLRQCAVKWIVQMAFDGIVEVLASEGRFELRDFGVFTVRTCRERKGRNPRTGESVMVPARKKIVFKAGSLMRKQVNGETESDKTKETDG